MERILMVDDDPNIVNIVELNLSGTGYEVVTANDGRQALKRMAEKTCDLAVVDVMMPYMDGIALTEAIRSEYDIPVIILTAKGQIEDKAAGFKAGTDDYLVKPFDPQELIFRIKALLRRYNIDEQTQPIRLGNVSIHPDSYTVHIDDKTYKLPLKEFELLHLLASYRGQVFSREQLIERIWGMDYAGEDRTVDVHIKRLRSRFAKLTDNFTIKTARGIGYYLEDA
ncbi:response regulator transcription factor [Salinicoccus albus]|uniref:response regulator transcription factor n=1 Tax=Salinicoccus albus TaxID=418756 RepID=UPI00037CE8E9|nr:response regulator transcription factor [Salinicoccus albus]